jgi:hypothetical protein
MLINEQQFFSELARVVDKDAADTVKTMHDALNSAAAWPSLSSKLSTLALVTAALPLAWMACCTGAPALFCSRRLHFLYRIGWFR